MFDPSNPAAAAPLDDESRRFFGRLARATGAWDAPALARVGEHVEVLRAHGLLPLFGARLRAAGGFSGPVAEALIAAHLNLVARELTGAEALEHALPALIDAGIRVLVCKGEALAAQVYEGPGRRERGDVDAWVAEGDFARACAVLASRGFVARASAHGRWVQTECSFVHPRWPQWWIDLHRQPFGQGALDAAFDFDAMHARGEAHGASGARRLDPADAMLFAAAHRIAHHPRERDRLLWLLDFDRMARQFPQASAIALQRARDARIGALLLDALASTARDFDTPLAGIDLAERERLISSEWSARLLEDMPPLRRAWFDFRSLPGAAARAGFIGEHVFPSLPYLRERYPRWPRWALPLAYPWRAIAGTWRALRG